MGDVKMQNLAVERASNGKTSEVEGNKGIMVSSEFYIHDDKVSTNGDHVQKTAVPESWTNLGDNAPGRAR